MYFLYVSKLYLEYREAHTDKNEHTSEYILIYRLKEYLLEIQRVFIFHRFIWINTAQ